jgi:hypothetical protein
VDTISSDNPPRLHYNSAKNGALDGQALDGCVPEQIDSTFLRSFYHPLMKDRSPHAKAARSQIVGFNGARRVDEADSSQNLPIAGTNLYAELA